MVIRVSVDPSKEDHASRGHDLIGEVEIPNVSGRRGIAPFQGVQVDRRTIKRRELQTDCKGASLNRRPARTPASTTVPGVAVSTLCSGTSGLGRGGARKRYSSSSFTNVSPPVAYPGPLTGLPPGRRSKVGC
jgi:hypothetical protein